MAPRRFFSSAEKPLKAFPAAAQRRHVAPHIAGQPAKRSLLAEPLWNTHDVRERLSLGSTDAVLRLVRDFGLPRIQISGCRHFRYVPAQVEAWIAEQNQRVLSVAKGA